MDGVRKAALSLKTVLGYSIYDWKSMWNFNPDFRL